MTNEMDEGHKSTIPVEIVLALPDRQELLRCNIPVGTTIERAIALSRFAEAFPDLRLDTLQVGVWGKIVRRTSVVQSGDRIELYRPLVRDPRDARRQLAMNGGVMGKGGPTDPA